MSEARPSLMEVTAGGYRWLVQAEYRDRLFGPDGLRLDEWLRTGLAQTIKNGPHRTVYHVKLPGLSCYVKHYRLHDLRAWLRELIRPSKARMEFERAVAVAARGLPTFTPLALGEDRSRSGPGDSFLITQELEGTEPLNRFITSTLPRLERDRQTLIRLRLAEALGNLVARMHDAGVTHQDLHAGNVLIRLDPNNDPCLFLIDLHSVRLSHSLDWQSSRANLIVFNRWYMLSASRADRLRFWRAYGRTRRIGTWLGNRVNGEVRALVRERARDLEQSTWQSNLEFWRKRDRRSLRNNRYFQKVRSTVVVGHAVTDLDIATLAPLLADPDEPFRRPGARVLKESSSSMVAELDVNDGGSTRRLVYKRFRQRRWCDPWLGLFRKPQALRSWYFGHSLLGSGLPTARPLAVLHRCQNGLMGDGYLLTEQIPAALSLYCFAAELRALAPEQRCARLRRIIDRLAQLVRELHRRQLSHRDLKSINVMVSNISDKTDGPPIEKAWLIDLVGVRRHRHLSEARRVRDLARLHAAFCRDAMVTRTDKLRFLRVYLQWGLLGREQWKRWWCEVERATQAKVARNARVGRPLA